MLPRIFDAFEQGETTITRKFGGLGLGLAISKGMVEVHGGTLGAESEGRDRGTTFRVALKALPEPGRRGRREPARARRRSAEPARRTSLRILLVEDEPRRCGSWPGCSGALGHEVTTAGTIAAALEAVEAGEFDLVVSDIGLPDGSGLDLMRQVAPAAGRSRRSP